MFPDYIAPQCSQNVEWNTWIHFKWTSYFQTTTTEQPSTDINTFEIRSHQTLHLWNQVTPNIASKWPNHMQGMQFICRLQQAWHVRICSWTEERWKMDHTSRECDGLQWNDSQGARWYWTGVMGPIATPLRQLAAAAVDDQQECQLTVTGYVMRIEKCWLCEMLLQGSMKYRMINLQEFSFWGPRRGIVSRSFGQAQKWT